MNPEIMGKEIHDLGESRCTSWGYCGAISRTTPCPVCKVSDNGSEGGKMCNFPKNVSITIVYVRLVEKWEK